MSYFFLLCAIISTAVGQLLYKKYQLTKVIKYYFLTIGLFLITPVFSFLALRTIPVDIVYIFTALTIFLVVAISKTFLGEKIDNKTYIGTMLIIIGVILYGI